jgi:hypothetical protein
MYNIFHEKFFSMKRDGSGKVIYRKGQIISPRYEIEGGNDTLELNKTYYLRFFFVNPPGFRFKLDSVTLIIKSIKTFKDFYIVKEQNSLYFEFTPDVKGSNYFIIYSSLKNGMGLIEQTSTLEINLFAR